MKPEIHVGFAIKRLSVLLKRTIDNSFVDICEDSPTGVHGFVIAYLYHNRDKQIFQKDLEDKFGIRRSTATSILKLMEKNNYITRTTAKHDSRLKELKLTDKAIEFQSKASVVLENIENVLTQGIDEKELDAFLITLEKMRTNLENHHS